MRWVRICMNDLENIPMGLILNWASLICPASIKWHIVFTITFCVARFAHTLCYALERQPSRGIVWFIAIISMLGFTLNGVIGALRL